MNNIKLSSLIKEFYFAKKRYSWLNPSGVFHPIKYSHGSDALRFTKEIKDPIMALWKMGYMRIVFMGNTLIAHNEVMVPNEKQKNALINLAIEAGDEIVEYDGGEQTKILWSAHDNLREGFLSKKHPNLTSWLLPDGTFIPVISPKIHADVAYHDLKIQPKRLNVSFIPLAEDDAIIEMAWKKGLMRIASVGKTIYVENNLMPPNDKQKQALINLAIENNFKEVIWSVHGKEHYLWAKSHIMEKD